MIKRVLPNVRMVKGYSNSYAIEFDDYWILIDAGMDRKAKEIIEILEERKKEVKAILITHAHLDHINGLAKIKERFPKALVCCSEAEKNAVEGKEMILPKGFKRYLFKFLSFFIRYRGVKVDRILEEGKFLDFEIIKTPGHTEGSLSFLLKLKGRNLLWVGDLVVNEENKLGLAPKEFNWDEKEIVNSLRKILRIRIDCLLPGHGEVIKEKVNERLESFVSTLG